MASRWACLIHRRAAGLSRFAIELGIGPDPSGIIMVRQHGNRMITRRLA